MKKLFTEIEWKEYSLHRQEYEERQRRRRKRRQPKKTLSKILEDLPGERVAGGFYAIPAPTTFSFIDNTEEMVSFLERVRILFERGLHVRIDLRQTTSITQDGITVWLSRMLDQRFYRGRKRQFAPPRDETAHAVLKASGIYRFVVGGETVAPGADRHSEIIHTDMQGAKVYPGRVHDLVLKAVLMLGRTYDVSCAATYRTLTELMQNTYDHAVKDSVGSEIWWSSMYCDPDSGVGRFVFLDTGIGILASQTQRTYRNLTLVESVKTKTIESPRDNVAFLKRILAGKVLSRTGLAKRGRGLPKLQVDADSGRLKNVIIITNDVWANLSEGRFRRLNNRFRGTFIYWELPAHEHGRDTAHQDQGH